MDLIEDDEPAGANAPEFSVSDLSGAVKRLIEGSFDHVRVRGEVGRVSRPRSGHVYLDLKDDRAVLAAICWKGVAAKLEVQPEEGMEVVATGRLTTYPGQSRYQLIIESIAPAGMGALMALLEKRRAALMAEGLFAAERKLALPYLPRSIGVVTSPSGAVIRDILHRLAERFALPVHVWPVAVQGKNAAGEIATAIRGFNNLPVDGPIPRPDVLIVARGGGSVEDLWGFNEEIVVRAAAESTIPLISAVGHETDTTLIDFASDRRAPTPTAAAEMAVPVRGELLATLANFEERSLRALTRGMEERRRRLRDLTRALPRPDEIAAERRQRLDAATERLPLALQSVADRKRVAFASGLSGRFHSSLLSRFISERQRDLNDRTRRIAAALHRETVRASDRLSDRATRMAALPDRMAQAVTLRQSHLSDTTLRLGRAGPRTVAIERDRLDKATRLLNSLGHHGVQARGYAIIRDDRGRVLKTAAAVKPGMALTVQFADGDISAVSGGKAADAKRATSKPKTEQGSLDL